MKHLLAILLLISFFGFAQDSTSYTTQEVKEFVPLNIMDEYEKAFNNKQKTMFKFGAMSSPNDFLFNLKPFVEFGKNINKKNAISMSLILPDYLYKTDDKRFFLLNTLNPTIEFKHYFKDDSSASNFNGKYVSIYAKSLVLSKNNTSLYLFDTNKEFIQRNSIELRYGYQFGGLLDFALALGVYKGYVGSTQEDATLKYTFSNKVTPYFTSTFRIGVDLFEKNKKNCEFIECYREQNSALKINLLDIFYIDKNFQHFKFSPEYERRIGKSAVTFTINPIFRYYNNKVFPVIKVLSDFSDLSSHKAQFEKDAYSTQTFYTELNTNLRWYFLLNKYIRKGQQNRNLDGMYLLAGIKNVYMNNTRAFNFLSSDEYFDKKNFSNFGIINLGGGMQSIVKGKYFLDYNLVIGISPFKHSKSINYTGVTLKFGIIK